MSDRRTVVLLVALIGALVGAVVVLMCGFALLDPFTVSGETGTRIDVSGELMVGAALGAVAVIAGVVTSIVLVRTQLRAL